MNKHVKRGFGAILLITGIAIGLILGSGLDFTQKVSANTPEPDNIPSQLTVSTASEAVYALGNAFADVAERVNPAVVTITTEKVFRHENSPYSGTPFEQFFRRMNPEREFRSQGLGSGVIVRASGVILTNNHVVDDVDNIKVRLIDGREFDAEIKGRDERTDLAVLQIKEENLPSIPLGDSDAIRVGEWVLAVGSPLQAEFAHTVTSGIVSAKGRTGVGLTAYEDFIQTDAAINPGNSGGALVNLKGELVGINTAIASRSGGNIGIGFAIPVKLASKVMDDILVKGRVVRGWLGVRIQDLTPGFAKMNELPTDEGVLIQSVEEDSPADKAGVQTGDIVIAIDGKKVRNTSELMTRIGSSAPGTRVDMSVYRDGGEKNIRVTLGEFPEEAAALAQNNRRAIEDLGLEVANLTRELRRTYELDGGDKGVIITAVNPNGIAARYDLREGDLIMRINRATVSTVSELNQVISDLDAGDPVAMHIKRGGSKMMRLFDLPRN